MIRRITLIERTGSGTTATVIAGKRKKRKKRSRGTKGIERGVRQIADAANIFTSNYNDRHKRSNRKKRDGWMKDYTVNFFRADRKGLKKIKPLKLFGF